MNCSDMTGLWQVCMKQRSVSSWFHLELLHLTNYLENQLGSICKRNTYARTQPYYVEPAGNANQNEPYFILGKLPRKKALWRALKSVTPYAH